MLKIGMIDVDLLNNGTRHPNLAQLKMASYCLKRNNDSEPKFLNNLHLIFLEEELNHLSHYDLLLVSKVFNFTKVPKQLQKLIDKSGKTLRELNSSIIEAIDKFSVNPPVCTQILIGGTGFFSDGGRNLDYDIEHSMPYYDLYKGYVEYKIKSGRPRSYYLDYLDASIGFTTRGCFRKCSFCVNKKYNKCSVHSPISEFVDPNRKIIFLWDDNFFALTGNWEKVLDDLNKTGKPFQFRQGLDLRLLQDKHAQKMAHVKYYGDFIFAFDHIQDKELIERNLKIWKKYCQKETKLYVLCAYDSRSFDPKYGIKGDFTLRQKDLIDIRNTFERIAILMKYGCLPYVMRYQSYKESPYRGIYVQLARWCNQPSIFKKMSFKEFCIRNQDYVKTERPCASLRALRLLEKDDPETYNKYVNLKYSEEKDKWRQAFEYASRSRLHS